MYANGTADVAVSALALYSLNQLKNVPNLVYTSQITNLSNWLATQKGTLGYLQTTTTSSVPLNITNAFILWALSGSGITSLNTEWTALEAVADASIAAGTVDTYFLAVLTSALYNLRQSSKANVYASYLSTLQNADGSLTISSSTAFGVSGQAGSIETTVYAVMAW
jgi:hypothetical protein